MSSSPRPMSDMHDYQLKDALDFLRSVWKSALFIDTGMGKTIILLTLICELIMEEITKRILVIAPVRVAAQTWPNEIPEWEHTLWLRNAYTVIRVEEDDPEIISAYKAAKEEASMWMDAAAAHKVALAAKAKRKAELWEQKARDSKNIHIINREAVRDLIDLHSDWVVVDRRRDKKTGQIVVTRKRVLKDTWPYSVIVIDESSAFKDYQTKRFKALEQVILQSPIVERVYELTATPAAETYEDLFAQIYLLDKGKRLGKNITAYREAHFLPNRNGYGWKIRKGEEEVIAKKISDIALVMKSGDYLDEQDPIFAPRRLRMTDSEMKMYREFERESVLTLASGEMIEAKNAGALSGKLLQLASGAIYNAEGQTRIVHSHKLEDLAQCHEDIGFSPLIVGYWYKSSLARLKKQFPKARVMDASGSIGARHGPWNRGEIDMLLMHPQGGGHGLNMQYGPGHHLYMYDLCWSWELFYQLYRRIHRQGQPRRCTVFLPTMLGTKDMTVAKCNIEKRDSQEILFKEIRALVRATKLRKAAELADTWI